MSNFKKDLLLGQKAENRLAVLLRNELNIKVDINNSSDYQTLKEFDLLLNDKIKVEVKHDLMASQTGNFAIEFKCNNISSGIASTKSTIWVYLIDDTFYFFNVKDLKQLFVNIKYHRLVKGGDGYRAKLALFNLKDTLSIAFARLNAY